MSEQRIDGNTTTSPSAPIKNRWSYHHWLLIRGSSEGVIKYITHFPHLVSTEPFGVYTQYLKEICFKALEDELMLSCMHALQDIWICLESLLFLLFLSFLYVRPLYRIRGICMHRFSFLVSSFFASGLLDFFVGYQLLDVPDLCRASAHPCACMHMPGLLQ